MTSHPWPDAKSLLNPPLPDRGVALNPGPRGLVDAHLLVVDEPQQIDLVLRSVRERRQEGIRSRVRALQAGPEDLEQAVGGVVARDPPARGARVTLVGVLRE